VTPQQLHQRLHAEKARPGHDSILDRLARQAKHEKAPPAEMHHAGQCREGIEKRVEDGRHGEYRDGPPGRHPDPELLHDVAIEGVHGPGARQTCHINPHAAHRFAQPRDQPDEYRI